MGLVAPTLGAAARAEVASDSVVAIYTKLAYQGSAAAGTGIVIDPSGLVLTNNHVIRGATTLRVKNVGNGRTYTATVLGYSVAADVALLKLTNASGVPTARIGGAPKVGAAVRRTATAAATASTRPARPGRCARSGSRSPRATARAAASA